MSLSPAAAAIHDADDDIRNRDSNIHIDDAVLPRDQAKVSVNDSGFLPGDRMCEGMHPCSGKWAFFDDHMDGFFASCKAVSPDVGIDRAGIAAALAMTDKANGLTDDPHCRVKPRLRREVMPFQHPSVSPGGPTPIILMEHSSPGDALQKTAIPLHQRNCSLCKAFGAEKVFLTRTFRARTPVAPIDGKPIGDGTCPVTARLQALCTSPIARDIARQSAH